MLSLPLLPLLFHALHICCWTENAIQFRRLKYWGRFSMHADGVLYVASSKCIWKVAHKLWHVFCMQITLIIIRLLCMFRTSSVVCITIDSFHIVSDMFGFFYAVHMFINRHVSYKLLFQASTFQTFYAWATIKLLGMAQWHKRRCACFGQQWKQFKIWTVSFCNANYQLNENQCDGSFFNW